MKAEVQKIFKLYEEFEEAGETATLTFSTRGGMSTVKLQLQASSSTAPSSSTSTPTLLPAPGKRRRHRGARARARRNQRAAAHQASLAEAATTTSASLDCPPPRPLHLLPSPPPESGRRQVTVIARRDAPTFSTLNVDGPTPPTPPSPTPPPPPPSPTPPKPTPPSPRPLSRQPPFCYVLCKREDHCEVCGRCQELCIDHRGCYCARDDDEYFGFDDDVDFGDCVVCNLLL